MSPFFIFFDHLSFREIFQDSTWQNMSPLFILLDHPSSQQIFQDSTWQNMSPFFIFLNHPSFLQDSIRQNISPLFIFLDYPSFQEAGSAVTCFFNIQRKDIKRKKLFSTDEATTTHYTQNNWYT